MTLIERIIDIESGEFIERPYTAEQIAEVEAFQASVAEAAAVEAARVAAVESGLAKLRALGLTDDEIGALMGAVS